MLYLPLGTNANADLLGEANTNLYILYIICPLLCSIEQKYILYMYLYRAFNK